MCVGFFLNYCVPQQVHPALLCSDHPVTSELMMYGHDIEGLGFFHFEVPNVSPPTPSLQAIVTVVDWIASPKMKL